MQNFISLKILDKFRFLYEKLGVDYDDMRLILSTKLTIDSRKTSNLLNNNQYQESSNQYKIMQIVYAIIGLCMMIIIINSQNIFTAMALYFSMFMFFMITTFISDFSSVILDIKDKGILATKGISLKTLNASKITHILIYMISISMSLSGFAIIASIKYGVIFSLVFLIEILLIDIFMVILSGLVYLLILKLFKGERLKDVISIIQIVVTMVFSIAYIFVINISQSMNIFNNVDLGIASYILPPFWFAAPFEIITTGTINRTLGILSFLALVIPIISILIYIRFTPLFENKLQKLSDESYSKNIKKYNVTMTLSKIICKDKEERIFFNFISNIMKKDRDFKNKVYPTIGLYYVYPIYMIFDKNEKYISSYMYMFLYFSLMIIPKIMIVLKYSKNYKASYIYKTVNIKNKMNVHKASVKACLINLILPLYLIQSIVFVYFYKFSIIPHIIITFLVGVFIMIITFKTLDKDMPFSRPINVLKKNEGIVENYLMMILILIMGGIHLLISFIGGLAVSMYLIVILIVDLILFKKTFNMR